MGRELLGLRWQHVDLDRAELAIRQTAQWLPRIGVTYRPPKTAKSSRSIALSPSTIERLRHHRQDQVEKRILLGPAYRDSDLFFCTVVGLPLDPSNIRRAWKKITDGAGVKMRFHDLRHAHATLMLQQGIHPKIVSERLGHATTAITLDTYSHVLPGLQAEAAEKFDALFSDKALANG